MITANEAELIAAAASSEANVKVKEKASPKKVLDWFKSPKQSRRVCNFPVVIL